MKHKDFIPSSMLVQNMFVNQENEQNFDDFNVIKTKKIRQSKPFSDKSNNYQQTKISERKSRQLRPLKSKLKSITQSIDIQFIQDQQKYVQEISLKKITEDTHQTSEKNQIKLKSPIQNQEKSQNEPQLFNSSQNNECIIQKSILKNQSDFTVKKKANLCLQLFDDSGSDENEDNQIQIQKKCEQNNSQKQIQPKKQLSSFFKKVSLTKNQEKPINQNVQPIIQKQKTKNKNVLIMNFDDDEESDQEPQATKQIQLPTQKEEMRKQQIVKTQSLKKQNVFFSQDIDSSSDSQRTEMSTPSIKPNPKHLLVQNSSQQSSQEQGQTSHAITLIRPINFLELSKMTSENYIYEPIPQNCVFQSIIKRYQAQTQNKNDPDLKYEMFDSMTYKSILKVRKCSEGLEIFLTKDNSIKEQRKSMKTTKEDISCALLNSNFFGTEFNCFKFNRINEKPQQTKLNRLITVEYETNLFGLKGPRKMQAYMPSLNYIIRGQKNLHQALTNELATNPHSKPKIQHFVNREPKWNSDISAFVLNFNGRATVSSVKNFIITRPNQYPETAQSKENYKETDGGLVLFGKIQKNVFNLDVKWPFNLVQGLALALSSFDKKIGCQ